MFAAATAATGPDHGDEMESISWLEAWSRWASGNPTLKDNMLWGLQILWWGRIGKIAAFVGGLTLVLDILGPERLRSALGRSVEKIKIGGGRARRLLFRLTLVAAIILGVAQVTTRMIRGSSLWEALFRDQLFSFQVWHLLIAVLGFFAIYYYVIPLVGRWAVYAFEHDKIAQSARTVSLVLFLIGFHFDMLAS
jgi:hypothetical protein